MLGKYFCLIPEYAGGGSYASVNLEIDKVLRGERIRHALTTSGVEPRRVAEACGISVQAVYSWLRGNTKDLRNEHLFCLADITGFSARWIATGAGPETSDYKADKRITHAVKVMENMNDYLLDKAVKDIDDLAELARAMRNNHR